ncbi:hypothetical protein [Actinophytocola sp.]|uniref:hypothetical protein n=1 Tax=Actinophytocola sp. TaxID=1872138 RepID=UPI00389ACE25
MCHHHLPEAIAALQRQLDGTTPQTEEPVISTADQALEESAAMSPTRTTLV